MKRKINHVDIATQIEERDIARKQSRYADADKIREALKEQGVQLQDDSDGTDWYYE